MGTKNNPGTFDCYENAEPDEPMFVLLARDVKAPALVREWAAKYKQQCRMMGEVMTPEQQAKYDEALTCAAAMTDWRRDNLHP